MKKILNMCLCLVIVIPTITAQKTETIKVTGNEYPEFLANNQYKYPIYKRATIALKNGTIARARINYNNFLNIMKYIDNKGDTLEITNAEDINYIAVATDSFFYDNGYYEWVASSSTARLVAKRTYKALEKSLVGAYGTASPAQNIESVGKILEVSQYELKPNEVLYYSKITFYYIAPIDGNGNNFVPVNKNNLNRLFEKKNVAAFMKENKTNLNKEEDLIDLMVHINKN